jgi:hypothetical protein
MTISKLMFERTQIPFLPRDFPNPDLYFLRPYCPAALPTCISCFQ